MLHYFSIKISCNQSAFLKLCCKKCFCEDLYGLSYKHSLIMLISNSWIFILIMLLLIIYWFSKGYLVQDSIDSFNVFIYSVTTRPGICVQDWTTAFSNSIDMWCSHIRCSKTRRPHPHHHQPIQKASRKIGISLLYPNIKCLFKKIPTIKIYLKYSRIVKMSCYF